MKGSAHQKEAVLVIGGTGFIGRHVCLELANRGYAVRSLSRRDRNSLPQVDHTTAALSDIEAVDQALDQADIVIALAASSLPATSNIDMTSEVRQHVSETIQLAERCVLAGVNHLVFASSGGTVYGTRSGQLVDESTPTEPISAYGVSKLAIEHYLRVLGLNSQLSTLSLRVANPYGSGQRTSRQQGLIAVAVERAMSDTPITVWGDGTMTRDFVHVFDVARAFAQAIEYRGSFDVINIGSGVATDLNTVLRMVEKTTGRGIRILREPGRSCDVQHNSLSIQRAATELGWAPNITLEEGIARYVDAIDSNVIDSTVIDLGHYDCASREYLGPHSSTI